MEIFSLLNIYGISILTIMMILYSMERKSIIFTLLFGFSCVGTSLYGFMAGTWPFGIIEAIWSLIAFRKYYQLKFKQML